MQSRFDSRDRLARLDPAVDYEEIYRTTALLEFPWDVTRALELALYRTFAVPTIAAQLDETGTLLDGPVRGEELPRRLPGRRPRPHSGAFGHVQHLRNDLKAPLP